MDKETSGHPGRDRIRIAAIGTANPPFTITQDVADTLMTRHYTGVLKPRTMEVMHQVLSHPSIRQRCIAVENENQLVMLKNEDPDVRMARFTRWAVDLSARAIEKALTTQGLGLSEEQMAVSRGVLSDFGNMSSPTVLFELQRIVAAGIAPGEWCVMVGFGAGFSAFAYLLQG